MLSGALVVGGCGGAGLALTAGPGIGVIDELSLGGGDGLSRYVLTLEPSVAATLLDDAALASAVVPVSAAAGQQAPGLQPEWWRVRPRHVRPRQRRDEPGQFHPRHQRLTGASHPDRPERERLTKSARLSGVGHVWLTQCRTTCTGTRL